MVAGAAAALVNLAVWIRKGEGRAQVEQLLSLDRESKALALQILPAPVEELAEEKARLYERKWHERYSSLLASRTYWKAMAFVLAFITAGEGFGLWQLARSSRTELYMVDRSGSQVNYAGLLKPVNVDDATWDQVRIEQFKKFLASWRTVTSDATAQKADWDRAFAFVGDGSQAHDALGKWYQANDPIFRANKGEIVTAQYRTYDREGANTYGIWWAETTSTQAGQSVNTRLWHMRVTYAIKISSNEKVRAENPMGLLVTELAFSEVQQ